MHKIDRRSARTEKEFQPSATVAFRANLAASKEITLGDDADQHSRFVNDRKTTDMLFEHIFAASTIVASGVTVMTGLVMT